MQEIEVQVKPDHLERIAKTSPIRAIVELIWNAYDADAQTVEVTFSESVLTKLEAIHISDDGDGIDPELAPSMFGGLGDSWKKKKKRTKCGRHIHGEKGQGRFKAFSLGQTVTWISDFQGKRFSITGNISDPKKFPMSDVILGTRKGCIVEITDVQKDFELRIEHGAGEKVRDIFALQLYQDPSFKIIYDGQDIDASEAINGVKEIAISITLENGELIEATLEIVEWRKKVERKLLLCLPGRFSFHDLPAGIQARGFEFTAYLTSDYFQRLVEENVEGLVELDGIAKTLIEAAKDEMREHFREREVERSRSKIDQWKADKIYPYEGNVNGPIERNERQVFDVVALNLADYSNDFEKSPPKSQKLILGLVKAAVESGPSALPEILKHVFDLPTEKQDELANLLKKTSLTAIVNAAKEVTDRLEFLTGLDPLIFEANSKRQLLERTQLHKILAQNTWIFGERFSKVVDDSSLNLVLERHLTDLDEGRTTLALDEPVLDAEGKVRIVDLMLSKRVPTPTDDEREHLVIELKRPKQKIDRKVISQIENYAFSVASDDRFKNSDARWNFVAISNEFDDFAEAKARQADRPYGLIADLEEQNIKVWIKTWSQVIKEAEGRLTFYKRHLEYEANAEDAFRYLSTIGDEYLSDEVKTRISELAAE